MIFGPFAAWRRHRLQFTA